MLREMGFLGILRVNPAIISALVFCSMVMLWVFLERAWFYVLYAGWDQKFWEKLKGMVQSGRLHEARSLCVSTKNVFARVFYTAVNSTHLTRADNEDAVMIEKENTCEELRKRLGVFATFSFIAPHSCRRKGTRARS